MSLFQCQHCGCCENTATSHQGFNLNIECFDWTYAPEREGLLLCSACGPAYYSKGSKNKYGGKWHNKFERVFLPLGMFKTTKSGNLEHIESGSEKYMDYKIDKPDFID